MKDLICLEDLKIQASLLLKSVRSSDFILRGKGLGHGYSIPELISPETFKLKHALEIIAHENGFNTWSDLKVFVHGSAENAFRQFFKNGYLNKWFRNYEEAKAHHHLEGGYLLPHKHHFFICEAPYVQSIGLDPRDPDWELIGKDWVKPSCIKAKKRLLEKWVKSQKSK